MGRTEGNTMPCCWRDVECLARMANAAPSMGLRRGPIGFRIVFGNFRQKCGFRWISIDVR